MFRFSFLFHSFLSSNFLTMSSVVSSLSIALLTALDGGPVSADLIEFAKQNAQFGPRNDPLRAHPSRLQTTAVNFGLCMARKIDKERVVPGTNKHEAGVNSKVYYEVQCSKKPTPGQKLCKTCASKESESSTGNRVPCWFGRLDEHEFYKFAYVVGSPWFFYNYPKGIPVDHASVVSESEPPTPVPVKKALKKKTKQPAPVPEAAYVAQSSAAKALEWITCKWTNKAGESVYFVRNTRNGNVYARNGDAALPTEAAIRDQFKGRWEDGTLNEFADEVMDD